MVTRRTLLTWLLTLPVAIPSALHSVAPWRKATMVGSVSDGLLVEAMKAGVQKDGGFLSADVIAHLKARSVVRRSTPMISPIGPVTIRIPKSTSRQSYGAVTLYIPTETVSSVVREDVLTGFRNRFMERSAFTRPIREAASQTMATVATPWRHAEHQWSGMLSEFGRTLRGIFLSR